jgi:hypothetical protein
LNQRKKEKVMVAYAQWLLYAQCAQWIQAHQQYPGQRLNAMSFQSRSPYADAAAPAGPNLMRPQQMQQLAPQQQQQQQLGQLRLQQQQQTLQQQKDAENARLWREAEEEERQEEEQEQEAAMQQKKQQQLMQLHKQEQPHLAPPPPSFGFWTMIQAAMQGVSLQVLYNVVLFAIASGAVVLSFKTQLASALNQTKAASSKVFSFKKPEVSEQQVLEQHVEDPPSTAANEQIPVAVAEVEEPLAPKSVASTTGKGAAAYVPRPPAERAAPCNNETSPIYLCEAKIHKYDGIDALQKALKTHSEHVAQGSNNCIVIAGKEATSCAQQ